MNLVRLRITAVFWASIYAIHACTYSCLSLTIARQINLSCKNVTLKFYVRMDSGNFRRKLKHLFRVCFIVSLLLEIWEVKAISLDLHATIYITINNFIRESSKNDDNTNTVKANAYIFFLKKNTKRVFCSIFRPKISQIAVKNMFCFVRFACRRLEKRLFRSITLYRCATHQQIGRKFYVIQSYGWAWPRTMFATFTYYGRWSSEWKWLLGLTH